MNIVIVAQYYPPHVGGLEVVAQKQARSLAAAGHQVTVITCACTGAPAGDWVEEEVRVRRARALNYLDRRIGIPFALLGFGFARKLRKATKAADLILLHDVFYPTSWISCLLSHVYRKPLLLVQHVGLVKHPSRIVRFIQRLVYASLGSFIFRTSKRIIVFNDNVKSFLLSRGVVEEKVSELRNGVDLEQFQPTTDIGTRTRIRERFGLPAARALVLFVGRLVPKKGVSELLKAAHESFELVLVGTGNIPASCRNLSHVHFLGPLAHSDLRELYRASDIFVLPTTGEVFTLAMQEAMGSGLPVVVGDDPGYSRYAVDRDLIAFVPPQSFEIQKKLCALLEDQGSRAEMASYSRRIAEEWFDWNKNFKSFERLVLDSASRELETRAPLRTVANLASPSFQSS